MKKVGRKWYGENPSEQLKLEKMRAHQRQAYRLRKCIADGNRTLEEFEEA